MFKWVKRLIRKKRYKLEDPILMFHVAGQNLHHLKQSLYKSKNKDKFRRSVIDAKYHLSTFTKLTQTLIRQNSNVFTKFVRVNKGESYHRKGGSGYLHTQGNSHFLKLNDKFNVIRAWVFLNGNLQFYLHDVESNKCEVINFNELENRFVNQLFLFTNDNVEKLKVVQHDRMLEMINME